MLSLPVQDRFRLFIKPHFIQFLNEINYKLEFDINRITVWADVDMYKWKEDPSVWVQKRGKQQNIYSVFVDGIFVCHIGDGRNNKESLADFWRGFLKAYALPDDDPGKIWIDKTIYEEKRKEYEQKEKKRKEKIVKAIKEKPVTNEVQEKAKELALDVVQQSTAS